MSFDHSEYKALLDQNQPEQARNLLLKWAAIERVTFDGFSETVNIDISDIDFQHGLRFYRCIFPNGFSLKKIKALHIRFEHCHLTNNCLMEISSKTVTTYFSCVFHDTHLLLSADPKHLTLNFVFNSNSMSGHGVKYASIKNLNFHVSLLSELKIRDFLVEDCVVDGNLDISNHGYVHDIKLLRSTFNSTVRWFFNSKSKVEFDGSNFHELVVDLNQDLPLLLKNFKCLQLFFSGTSPSTDVSVIDVTVQDILTLNNITVSQFYAINCKIKAVNVSYCSAASIRFANSEIDELYFQQSSHKEADFIIHLDEILGTPRFEATDCIFKRPIFIEKVIFETFKAHTTRFLSTTEFRNITFKNAPEFFEAEMFSDTRFINVEFPDVSYSAAAAYRTLKQHMTDAHHWHEELRFSSLELESIWRGESWRKSFATKILGWFYFHSNGFGLSIKKPFIVLAFLTAIGWLTYTVVCNAVYFSPEKGDFSWKSDVADWSTPAQALAYSVVNSLGPIKLHPSLQVFQAGTPLILVFSTFHAAIATYLWFLIFSWVRRRFRTH